MENIFNNKSNNNKKSPNKTLIQAIDEFLRRVSNLLAIAGSIFTIFVLLMQVRQVNIDNFYIANYDKIINIITVCFVIILIDQIRIAPRKLYIVVPIIQIIGLLFLNFFSRKYYDVYANRIIWTVALCLSKKLSKKYCNPRGSKILIMLTKKAPIKAMVISNLKCLTKPIKRLKIATCSLNGIALDHTDSCFSSLFIYIFTHLCLHFLSTPHFRIPAIFFEQILMIASFNNLTVF